MTNVTPFTPRVKPEDRCCMLDCKESPTCVLALVSETGEEITKHFCAAHAPDMRPETPRNVLAAAQVLAKCAPYYFADASAKMETRPNPSAVHIAGMMLAAAERTHSQS